MPKYKSILHADVTGKTLLVRVDLNVPMRDGDITDTARIDRLIPGLKDLLGRGPGWFCFPTLAGLRARSSRE